MSKRAKIVTGDLITMDPARPRAEAMAIRDHRIIAVGTRDEAAAAAGPDAPVEGAPGTVVPGFTDSHVHMLYAGLELRRLDLSGARSVAEILEAIGLAARAGGSGFVFAVGNFELEDLVERRLPSRAELDAVSGGRPVFVDQRTHDALVNSSALELAGIGPGTPDPPGGRIERDASGNPTGRLVERPAFDLVHRLLPPPDATELRRALEEIQSRFLAAGITGIVDPGLDSAQLAAYQEVRAAGELTVRTTVMPLVDPALRLDEVLAGIRSTRACTGSGDDRLRFGGVKVYYDGTGSFGTALLREPWPGGASCGERVVSRELHGGIAEFCAREHWSLGVHAVGGGAIDEVLETFAGVDSLDPIRPLRFTLIHAYLIPSAENIRRAAELGVVVALQPGLHWRVGTRLADLLGEDAVARMTPVRSWLDGGVLVAGGSDGPDFPLEPLFGIWQACTRHVRGRDEALGPNEAISPGEALRLWTVSSSYAAFAEHERGSLTPGKLADWTALSADPLLVPLEELREATVIQTAMGGRVVHEA